MARQWSFHLSLLLVGALAAACAAGDELDTDNGLVGAGSLGGTTPGPVGTAGGTGTTGTPPAGGTILPPAPIGTTPGGTVSGTTPRPGTAGGVSGTASAGGGASGTASAGGGASGTASAGGGASGTASAGGGSASGAAGGGTITVDAGIGSADAGRTGTGSTTGGTGATAGAGGRTAGGGTATGGTTKAGDCCQGEDCTKCITDPPATFSGEQRGPWGGLLGGGGSRIELPQATVYVPPDSAKKPWAGFAIIPGFTNTGPEMAAWGPYFAGWGIVTAVTYSGALDTPGLRGQWLLDAVAAMKRASALQGKMSGNYGTGGYSMGGGGTTVASTSDKTLRSSIGLAPWAPSGRGITTPTIHFCGGADLVAGCSSNASWAYSDLPMTTPKALVVISSCDHLLCWFSPDSTTGEMGLLWNKVFLEGDKRWNKLLLNSLKGGLGETVQTNVTEAMLNK